MIGERTRVGSASGREFDRRRLGCAAQRSARVSGRCANSSISGWSASWSDTRQQVDRRRIGPLQVVDHEQRRCARCVVRAARARRA
jgi:hypothetical protein